MPEAKDGYRPHVGLYPGIFDLVPLGHIDIATRAIEAVDRLVIGLATGIGKAPSASLEERVAMWEQDAAAIVEDGRATIEVVPFANTLQVDLARNVGQASFPVCVRHRISNTSSRWLQ